MFDDLSRALLGVPGFVVTVPPGSCPKGWHQHRGVGTTRFRRTLPARLVPARDCVHRNPPHVSWRLAV